MTVATGQRIYLSESLQSLIDSRLDTIDRMLLGRAGRAERLAIVREVESQIQELLGEREAAELSREDVLAVLARLDPPEAFLPEEAENALDSGRRGLDRPLARTTRQENLGVARVSGILGLAALSCLFLLLLSYLVAIVIGSEGPFIIGAVGTSFCMFIGSVLGLATGYYARKSGVWALVGIVTSIVALPLSLVIGSLLVLVL